MKTGADNELRTSSTAAAANPSADLDLGWLLRRRELLMRAIAEMEEHQLHPHLTHSLLPDVPELLAWARNEIRSVERQLRGSAGVLVPQRRLRTKSAKS